MATQICPECKKDSFTWSVDDGNITTWGCFECHYSATEDELLEVNCEDCGNFSKMQLLDGRGKYWWCCYCNYVRRLF
jgi:ssDNA-binding Zn-finger/Zn-ribbon topoisomerase 1